ncbi:hypothetical protein J0910_28280 [Nocardiopsis sp. CNT-189]|uniref:hypothetical protein n=1 Tax=Nocardiopsis oceanisediminis TaxID=2816862 RepID=UPI003B31E0F9
MSNIYTSFLRIPALPGRSIDRGEAERIIGLILNDRGSYNVPVAVRPAADGSLLDVQAGPGKNPDFYDFWYDHPDRYACVWERFFDEGGSQDVISRHGQDGESGDHGPVWYGFDEVRVAGPADRLPGLGAPSASWEPVGDGLWRAGVAGRYQTGNDRTDIGKAGPCAMDVEWDPPVTEVAPGGLVTPTTPTYDRAETVRSEPDGLRPLLEHGDRDAGGEPRVERVELLWRGRVVRRARPEPDVCGEGREWEQRSADDWDNCLHPAYLASMEEVRRHRRRA